MLTDEIIIGTAEFFSDHKGVEQKDIVDFASAIESAACAPLLERIAELERQLESATKDAKRYRGLCRIAKQQADALGPIYRIDVRRTEATLFSFSRSVDAVIEEKDAP